MSATLSRTSIGLSSPGGPHGLDLVRRRRRSFADECDLVFVSWPSPFASDEPYLGLFVSHVRVFCLAACLL